MATFRFRLAPVLRVRERVKDQKSWELRALYESRREIVVEIDALERQLSQGAFHPAKGEIFTVFDLSLRAEYEQSLASRIRNKHAALSRLDGSIAEKRAELVEATRRVKSLEQLRRRHEERYWREQNVAQQRFTDEVAQRKFVQPLSRKKIPT